MNRVVAVGPYRVGLSWPRNVYRQLRVEEIRPTVEVAKFDDPAEAAHVVELLNADLARRSTEHAGFTCPRCQRTSHNPYDRREGYCGACHAWTGEEPDPSTRWLDDVGALALHAKSYAEGPMREVAHRVLTDLMRYAGGGPYPGGET